MAQSGSSTFRTAEAEGYERLMGRWSRRLAVPFLDFVAPRDGSRFLDAGCGTGSLAFALAERCPSSEITGIDLSEVYVAYARARNRAANLDFRHGDATRLPFAEGSYGGVLSLLVLHFVPDSARALEEMRRVAAPGATVAAAVWDARGGVVFNRIFWDTAAALLPEADARRAEHFTRPLCRPGELSAAFRAAGLAEVEERLLTIRMDFADFEDYRRPFFGKEGPIAEYTATLAPAERDRLLEALRRAYLDGEADGPRSYAASAWAVKARKPF